MEGPARPREIINIFVALVHHCFLINGNPRVRFQKVPSMFRELHVTQGKGDTYKTTTSCDKEIGGGGESGREKKRFGPRI